MTQLTWSSARSNSSPCSKNWRPCRGALTSQSSRVSCGKLKRELVSSDVVPNKRVAKSTRHHKERGSQFTQVLGLRQRGEGGGRAAARTCGQQKYGPGCSHVGGLQLFALLHLPHVQNSLRKRSKSRCLKSPLGNVN